MTRAGMICWTAAVLVAGGTRPITVSAQDAGRVIPAADVGKPVVIDDFHDMSQWTAAPSDGVSLAISSDRGRTGGAMRMTSTFTAELATRWRTAPSRWTCR